MVTTIQPRQSFLPSTGSIAIEGLEGLNQQDLILPRKTIIQPSSKREGADEHLGYFHDNLSNEMVPSIEAVILQISHARTLWSGDQSDSTPECASYDGVTGRVYGACADCQFNYDADPGVWGDKDIKQCRKGYLFLSSDRADGSMFLLGAMGTSVKPARILISSFVQKRRSPFSAVVKFETQKIIEEKGKYYILKATISKWLTDDETREYREMHLALKGVPISDIEPEANGDGNEPESHVATPHEEAQKAPPSFGEGRLPF